MSIKRFRGEYEGRNRAVAWGDLVFTVATGDGPDVETQTRATLDKLDRNLADAGSDRSRILSATVYLTDMSTKTAMDDIWCEWIGPPENWPQRACVEAGLAHGHLVEITLVAAPS